MEIKDPYISVELSDRQFASIKRQIKKELESLGFKDIKNLDTPHISLSYVVGDKSKEELEFLAEEIVYSPFKMKMNGIKVLDAPYYKASVVSISLHHTDDFIYVQEYLKENFSYDNKSFIQEKFKDGFQAHISCFIVPTLSEEEMEALSRYLEICLSKVNLDVFGEKITVYNGNREKIIEKHFSNDD